MVVDFVFIYFVLHDGVVDFHLFGRAAQIVQRVLDHCAPCASVVVRVGYLLDCQQYVAMQTQQFVANVASLLLHYGRGVACGNRMDVVSLVQMCKRMLSHIEVEDSR